MLHHGFHQGHLTTVQWLLTEGGASIEEVNLYGRTALLGAAECRRLTTVQWLLAEGGANLNETNNDNENTWDALNMYAVSEEEEVREFLHFILLLEAPPARFLERLPQEHRPLVAQAARIRARLPQYLEEQRSLVLANCPLYPPPLLELVLTLATPSNEDIWASGLGD